MNTVMPIGNEFFSEVRTGYYFVDKSGFLSELFRTRPKVLLLTRPRRFGKTLLMSMTQQFLDIQDGEAHRKLFEGLKVMEDPVAMAQQGTCPVIFLTLRAWEGDTWQSMQTKVSWYLAELYGQFMFLSEAAATPQEQKSFSDILHGVASMDTLSIAFSLLCKLLERYYGKKAVLLIDEYDAPLQYAWSHRYYQEAIGFYRGLFSSALKSNPSLDFAILTGVLRIAKESIFSGLNNLKVSTVNLGGFATACGYTKDEVANLAHALGFGDKLEEIAAWYDGYNFQGVEIYNPWSVNNYFSEHCKAEPYWVNTSGNSILRTMLERIDRKRARDLQRLMDGKTIRTTLEDSFIYQDIEEHRANLYALLLATGYLKCISATKEADTTAYDLCLPNRELRSVFRLEIMKYLTYPDGSDLLFDLLEAMQTGETEEFEDDLQSILRNMVSFHDAAQPESFYHGLMLGLSIWLESRYRVVSNRESGYGRFDLAFFPKQPTLPGILLEFKSVKDMEELAPAAKEACKQINENAYATEFEATGVQTVWCYGIAFCKKHVLIKRKL